jgi:hypothetical protein
VTTGSPQRGAGVLGGDEQFGACDLRSNLGGLTLLRMKGPCEPTLSSFSGKYVLSLSNGKRQASSFSATGINGSEGLSLTSQPSKTL